jgi:hypothetical protein
VRIQDCPSTGRDSHDQTINSKYAEDRLTYLMCIIGCLGIYFLAARVCEGECNYFDANVRDTARRGRTTPPLKKPSSRCHCAALALSPDIHRTRVDRNLPVANLPERKTRLGAVTKDEMKNCRWVKPELVAQIESAEWTVENHLRHPNFVGLRDDKNPSEVVRED